MVFRGRVARRVGRKMGFRVAAVWRGGDIARYALSLGAHRYIDINEEDAAATLQNMGGAQAIVTTLGNADAVASLLPGLAPQGRLVLLGVGKSPLPVMAGRPVGGERRHPGSMKGAPYENEKRTKFSVLTDIRASSETNALDHAN